MAIEKRQIFDRIEERTRKGEDRITEKTFLVEKHHSAQAMGSGNLEVLSTPSLIAFMENTAKEAANAQLAAGETTVGIE